MISIYCIEDCDGRKYVGSTKNKLNHRLNQHKCDKTNNVSSSKLNLHNCIIYSLETCNESNRKEREKYWINKIDCVNKYKLYHDKKVYDKNWVKKNKEKKKEYYENNKDIMKAKSSYNYYKKINNIDKFKDKQPEKYNLLVDKGLISV